MLYWNRRHRWRLCTIPLHITASKSVASVRLMRALPSSGHRSALLKLMMRSRRRRRLSGHPGQSNSGFLCSLTDGRRKRRLIVIIALSGMCAFRIWHSFALSLRSSPVCSMCRSFQHRSSRWQNRHIILVHYLDTRIVRSPLRVQAKALDELGGIFWHFFEFGKFGLAVFMLRSVPFQSLGAIPVFVPTVHLPR